MKLLRLLLLATALLCAAESSAAQPVLVMGTYQKGNNLTEPRPQRSTFLETVHGGVVVIGDGAGYYLYTKVIKHPDREFYIKVEYEDPQGGAPLVNDMAFMPEAQELWFSAPQFVQGLKGYSDYQITVHVFESTSSAAPIDTLRQTIRSYVDTRGAKPKLYKRLKEKR